MNTIFIEIGVFCIALIAAVCIQVYIEGKGAKDCQLFCRLLIATIAIFVVDTTGWVIDGNPVCGQVWFTTVIDALDLVITTVVCWCWVQYAWYIAYGEGQEKRRWYQNISNWLMLLQILLVLCSQIFGFYFSVDEAGVYHREKGYAIHSAISMFMLAYSSWICLKAAFKETDMEKKREQRFIAYIIVIPVLGNIFQFFVYGYPTVWLCMCFMIYTVFVHIQNKRTNAERERQNMRLEKALEQAQIANLAKTDFLSCMSHDMRTPMNAILGTANLLSDRTDPEEIRADVEQIKQSGEYLLCLINDTLDMNKIEAGKLELHPAPVNSEEMFQNVLATAQVLAAKKGVSLKLEFPDIKPGQWIPVVADTSRVEQIFMNLITNAVKFTPQGGVVTMHMDTFEITQKSVTDRYIISDTGIGMSEDFQKHLFEAFSQEGRANTDHESGTGLGLAIVKQIVDMMKGSIEVESRVNEGTRFTVILTYPRFHGTLEAKKEQTVDLSVLDGKRILLCEDHPVNAQIAERLLEKKGIITERAENGKTGVDIFQKSEEGYYAALLMDIRMPVMNGIEATKAIRLLERPDARTIPIIAMTANAFDEDIKACIEAGMNAHVAKPIDPERLYEVIAEAL